MRLPLAIVLLALLSGRAVAQEAAFEAVSVKAVTARAPGAAAAAPDRFVRPGVAVRPLIAYAYDRPARRVVGGPAWVDSQLFAINAKAAAPVTTAERMRELVRRLLADRFALQAHEENRQVDVYVMTVARADGRLGPMMKPAATDCSAITPETPSPEIPRGTDGVVGCGMGTLFNTQTGALTARMRGQSLPQLARLLEERLGRPVIDGTGLAGRYDMDLTTLSGDLAALAASVDAPLNPIVALSEQLGLTLKPERSEVPLLVIDRVETPTPD